MGKEAFLKERGWYQWYNPDYWCHKQFSTNGADETYRGMSTEEAYLFETDEEAKNKILQGMELYHSALSCLSNMGSNQND